MNLNEAEINNYLAPFLGRYEDSFQEAWVKILESKPQTLEEVTPIIKKIRSKEINQYLNRKYREESLYKPIGKGRDEKFTFESILESPGKEDIEDEDNGHDGLYKKIVDFLIGEYFNKKNENIELRRRDIELKAERLRLRGEWLRFKKDRFESWKKLMEDRGKQKENQFKFEVQLRREKLKLKKEQFYLQEKRRLEREEKYKRFLQRRENKCKINSPRSSSHS
ncbi:MAG: hypothetical protein FJ106_14425 [Deltaproteobacteria bacterium]|nr:hypothetical protein [Deltaproteobacteria bacterium]